MFDQQEETQTEKPPSFINQIVQFVRQDKILRNYHHIFDENYETYKKPINTIADGLL